MSDRDADLPWPARAGWQLRRLWRRATHRHSWQLQSYHSETRHEVTVQCGGCGKTRRLP